MAEGAKTVLFIDLLSFLSCSFQMSKEKIYSDPYQLAAQLIGRMSDYETYTGIHKLLKGANLSQIPCLYPLLTCFEKPGGPLVRSMAGHEGGITLLALTKDGKKLITVSVSDYTLRYAPRN